jgi:hypothetical protein
VHYPGLLAHWYRALKQGKYALSKGYRLSGNC